MTTAIYALSGDPITFGHIDIIERASKAFDKLIVALGNNPDKKYCLSSEERLQVAKASLNQYLNVTVEYFDGLLVDFAYEQRATVIVRGIRNAQDMEFEKTLDQINSTQLPIDTFLLFSKNKLEHISSSSAKAIQKESGFIHEYVPLPAKKILEKKISNQLIVGITGIMGSGKSYVGSELQRYSQIKNQENPLNPLVHNIELDDLVKDIYNSEKPSYIKLKEEIHEHFGTLDKKVIAQMTFQDETKEHLNFLNKIFEKPIMVMLRQKIRGLKGIILLNAALLVEGDLLNLCNNTVLLVNCEDDLRKERLKTFRNIESKDSDARVRNMFSNKKKETMIKKAIEKSHFGKLIKVNNQPSLSISSIYDDLVKMYN
jgi:pantetheine-phosphate adenylyltransferase